MIGTTLKSILLSATPGFLKPLRQRLEASPLGSRLAYGAFWSTLGALVSRGLMLISSILVGRMLNAQGFGELGIIQSTVGLFGTVAGLGLGMSSTKYVAEFRRSDPDRAGRVIALGSATAWVSSSMLAVTLFFIASGVASRTLAAPHLGGLLQISSVLLLLNGVNGAQMGALSGFESFKRISKINLISGLASFPIMVGGAWLSGIQGAVWALVLSTVINCVLSWGALRAEARANAVPLTYVGCLREWPLLLHFNLPGVLNAVMLSFSAWACGAILVNQAGGYTGMGVYSAVKRIQQVPEILLSMAMAPFLPVLSEAFGRKDMLTYGKALMVGFSVAALLVIPFSLVLAGAPWLALLPYGDTYGGGEPVVQWMMVGSIAYGLLWPLGTIIISLGRMWMAFAMICANTVLFLGLGWFLIPRFGVLGYAAAATTSFILSNIPAVVFLYSHLGPTMREFKWRRMLMVSSVLTATCGMGATLDNRWAALAIAAGAGLGFVLWRMFTWLRPFRRFLSDSMRPRTSD